MDAGAAWAFLLGPSRPAPARQQHQQHQHPPQRGGWGVSNSARQPAAAPLPLPLPALPGGWSVGTGGSARRLARALADGWTPRRPLIDARTQLAGPAAAPFLGNAASVAASTHLRRPRSASPRTAGSANTRKSTGGRTG